MLRNWKKILWRTGAVIFAAYIVLVIARMPHAYEQQKTDEQVAKIHATKLTLDDVLGKNLPPDPGAHADITVQGIDANRNGIRDDVELAIFKEYPNSAKTRAELLQYALALQMEVIQPMVNIKIVTEVVREQSRAYACVGELLSRKDMNTYIKINDQLLSFVKTQQFNTDTRKTARKDFVKKIGSYSESTNRVCDFDHSVLPN